MPPSQDANQLEVQLPPVILLLHMEIGLGSALGSGVTEFITIHIHLASMLILNPSDAQHGADSHTK